LQPGTWNQIFDSHTTLNLGLHEMAVYLIGEIGMGAKEAWGLTSSQLLNFHAYSIQELRMRMLAVVSNSSKMSRQ